MTLWDVSRVQRETVGREVQQCPLRGFDGFNGGCRLINRFLEEHTQQSKPFTWTADPDKIIAAPDEGIKR